MSDSFQPEQPYEPSRGTSGRAIFVWGAVLSALGVIMLLAVFLPDVFETSWLNWLIALGAGVLVFAAVLLVGLRRDGKSEQPYQGREGEEIEP